MADERVEARKFTAVVVHRGVRPETLIGDAVAVLLPIGCVRVLGLQAVKPSLLVLGIQDRAGNQCSDPRGQVARCGEDATGSGCVGGVLVGVVDGLECSAPGRDLFRPAIWHSFANPYPAPSSRRSANNTKPTLLPAVIGSPNTPNQITACSGTFSKSSRASDRNRRWTQERER